MRALCGEKSFFSPLFTGNLTLFFVKTSTRAREQILNKLEHVLGSRDVISDPVDTAPFKVDWKGLNRTRSAGEENRNEQSILTPRALRRQMR